GFRNDHRIAVLYAATRNSSRKPAEAVVQPIDPLHREPERLFLTDVGDIDSLKVLEKRRASIPWRVSASSSHIVAVACRNRDRGDAIEREVGGKLGKLRNNAIENALVVLDQVDLVDRKHHLPNAEKRCNCCVPARLSENPVAAIDQNDRKLRVGCSSRHVPRILLMTRNV